MWKRLLAASCLSVLLLVVEWAGRFEDEYEYDEYHFIEHEHEQERSA